MSCFYEAANGYLDAVFVKAIFLTVAEKQQRSRISRFFIGRLLSKHFTVISVI